jgi:hypothetical protein
MAQSLRRVDLRLTIPAAAPFHAVAAELARRFAEYAGAAVDAAAGLAHEVEGSMTAIAKTGPDASVELDMRVQARQLVVTVISDTTRTLTCPLPD